MSFDIRTGREMAGYWCHLQGSTWGRLRLMRGPYPDVEACVHKETVIGEMIRMVQWAVIGLFCLLCFGPFFFTVPFWVLPILFMANFALGFTAGSLRT